MTFKLRQFALMHGIKTAYCRGDTTLKNGAGKEIMEFLKDILGEDLYKQVADAVNAHNGKPENKEKQVKIADLGSGQYVDKGKYDTAVAEKENLAGQIKTLNTTIGDLKKNNAAQKASRAGSAASGTAASGSAGSGSSSGTANRSTSSATRLGSDTSRNVTVPYMAMLMRSQGKNDTSISSALRRDGYSSAEIAQILQQMKR